MADITDIINLDDRNNVIPPFAQFIGQESYFPPGEAPLPTWVGWVVVVGFGLLCTAMAIDQSSLLNSQFSIGPQMVSWSINALRP